MPVNMDPKRKRKGQPDVASNDPQAKPDKDKPDKVKKDVKPHDPENQTEADLAEKEWKNLWEATEVIDMDRW